MNRILFIGLDVDDRKFQAYLISDDKEEYEFQSKPNVGALIKKLDAFRQKGWEIRLCYEASYLGFSLHRALTQVGLHCDVIAPSLIPETPGPRVKTDRLDSRKLARYYKAGLLCIVHPPKEEDEAVRDLLRSRSFLVDRLRRTKLHILSQCRRAGIDYRNATQHKQHWTVKHLLWLNREVANIKIRALKFNLEMLLEECKQLEKSIEEYDKEVTSFSQMPRFEKKVKALGCFRGIATNTAMTLVTELGDINRFDHPKKIVSFIGLDISEYSSGGKEKKYRITKMGNRFARTALIEACQKCCSAPMVSRYLKLRRENADEKFIEIADRCHKRIYRKSSRLLHGGKLKNKVKVAAAREMVGFLWESLRAAA